MRVTQTKSNKQETKKPLLTDIIIKILPFTKCIFERFPWLSQFINFSMVGIINMVLSYAIYAFLIYLSVHPQIANQIAFWLSVLNGYLLNKFWVFEAKTKQKSASQLLKYVITYAFNNVLGIFLLWLYIDILHLNAYIAPFISLPITIPMNYCINKFWIFKKSKTNCNI